MLSVNNLHKVNVAKALRKLRRLLNLRQSQLARLAVIDLQELKNLEGARVGLSRRVAYQLSLATGLDDDHLWEHGKLQFLDTDPSVSTLSPDPSIEHWNRHMGRNVRANADFALLVQELLRDTRDRIAKANDAANVFEAQLWFAMLCAIVQFRDRSGRRPDSKHRRWINGTARARTPAAMPSWAESLQISYVNPVANGIDGLVITRCSLGIPVRPTTSSE